MCLYCLQNDNTKIQASAPFYICIQLLHRGCIACHYMAGKSVDASWCPWGVNYCYWNFALLSAIYNVRDTINNEIGPDKFLFHKNFIEIKQVWNYSHFYFRGSSSNQITQLNEKTDLWPHYWYMFEKRAVNIYIVVYTIVKKKWICVSRSRYMSQYLEGSLTWMSIMHWK